LRKHKNSANNYLGLSNHPDVAAAAIDAIRTHGFGLSSVRFICGTQDLHKQLEAKISEFHGTEDTILFPSCFDANAGLFEALLTPADAVISDELNHASIIDGIRLCKATRYRYKHMDMADLERCLKEATDAGSRIKVCVINLCCVLCCVVLCSVCCVHSIKSMPQQTIFHTTKHFTLCAHAAGGDGRRLQHGRRHCAARQDRRGR
jgi:hypothetical protein